MNLLEVSNVSKRFCRDPRRALAYAATDMARDLLGSRDEDRLRRGEFWALRDVSLHLGPGEVLGVVGHNGAGKSTLINLVVGLQRPTLGRVSVNADRAVLLDSHGGMSPHLTGRENIENRLLRMGRSRQEIRALIEDIADYAGLESVIDAPTGTYSTGMRVRLALSIYAAVKPQLLVVDEGLSGGDVRFRVKFHEFLRGHVERGGGILLASHDLATVQALCQRCVLLDQGVVASAGLPDAVIHEYLDRMKARDLRRQKLSGSGAPPPPEGAAKGRAKVVVTEAVIGAGQGGPVRPLCDVEIRIVCEAREVIKNVLWILEIGCGDIFPLSTSVAGYEKARDLEPGRNNLTCRIAPLPLLPGLYQLRVALRDRDTGWPLARRGYTDLPFSFEVQGDVDPALNLARHRGGLINMPVQWD